VARAGSSAHGHVWRVKIDGKAFALKMFRHVDAPVEEVHRWNLGLESRSVADETVQAQLAPFGCEARAYGRLHETGSEAAVAWRCYGCVEPDEETYASHILEKVGLPRRECFSRDFVMDEQVAGRQVFPIYALVRKYSSPFADGPLLNFFFFCGDLEKQKQFKT
jgi:hypothetical protein